MFAAFYKWVEGVVKTNTKEAFLRGAQSGVSEAIEELTSGAVECELIVPPALEVDEPVNNKPVKKKVVKKK
jgi:hypothetical protein